MNNLKNKKIAIIGAGPSGLTLARLLQMESCEVKIYERDINKDARAKGATLDLHEESGLKALEHAGLLNEFKANYRPGADHLRIVDKNGKIVFDEQVSPRTETYRPEIDRGPLQTILLDSLKPGTVDWDSQFVSLSSAGESWSVDFKNRSSISADMVIGADGANSRVRPYITGIRPFYVGITAVEGAVYQSKKDSPKVHQLLHGGKIFAMGDSKSLIVSSKGDGSLVFYPGFKKEENWARQSGINFTDKEQVLAWFKQEYAGWDSIWNELFENASGDFVPRPQYCLPLDQSWESLPNLTMLGDAAHLMPPYAGEGVNMAMLDALELSQCLLSDDFANLHDAVTAYEKQMRARASEIAAITLESTAALHSPEAIPYIMNVIGESLS